MQENLELKLKIKELEVKNSHLLDDVILRGASRIQRADENDRDADPLDELFFPRNKKQLNSEGSKVIHDDTIQSDGCQVVRPRRLRSNIQRESLPVVSIESGSESEGDLGSESSCAKNQLKTGKSNNMKGSSLNITRKEPQKSSNPNNIIFHISYIFISYLNFLRRVALRQKPFFKGPSGKNLITAYS